MEIILAEIYGFCAGVKRAVDILATIVEQYQSEHTIYVLHEIVHNKSVIESFTKQGVIFIDNIEAIPDCNDKSGILILSAHGVSRKVEEDAKKKKIRVIDATCPLVSKVHKEAKRYEDSGKEVILIGHKDHPEVKGTKGRVDNPVILVQTVEDIYTIEAKDPNNLSYVTQTTLSLDDTRDIIDALKSKFPNITGPNLKDICYATQNRQNAAKKLSEVTDIILVVGSKNSSNSNRLLDLCLAQGKQAYLIDDYSCVDTNWFTNITKLGITAGASAPDVLIKELIDHLRSIVNIEKISTMSSGITENVRFKMPILI
ncbi:4-hydroxy-3-methylbut-2-enyl diphosphate reductase [Wolbachia pipientis]|uniref:4-hydroxy-3-methylbut-2-enyl diphosphate reductase n=1 Tax=Wolbachia pipientis TaxID=955 RepID=A0A1E7QKJ3_WOLPI|nr:4-hydroxy-3-methylbut-2-enyl diphosphate reductase [Wolbachia pipientis]OEY86739.1 4-hydroxy-3-methylbut-2-enyl diphosphate reductase [Wolbachia pipientis]